MIKSLELTISLIFLFGFLVFAYQIQNTNNHKLSLNYSDEIQNLINYNGNNTHFRENVNNNEINLVYDTLFPFMNKRYVIGVCDSLEDNCLYSDENIIINKKTTTYSYHFSNINKTMYLITY